MINKYFDHCYLINLDERYDRLERVTANCSMIGIEFERFPATHHSTIKDFKEDPALSPELKKHWTKGAAALIHTTIKLIEDAKKRGFKSILVLEDDVEFHENINKIVSDNMKHIPSDWEMIQFGGLHIKPYEYISDNLVKVGGAECLHCYAINESIYDDLLFFLRKLHKPLDYYTSIHIHPRGKSYCFLPGLAYQFKSFSNIVGEVIHYEFLKMTKKAIDARINNTIAPEEEKEKNDTQTF